MTIVLRMRSCVRTIQRFLYTEVPSTTSRTSSSVQGTQKRLDTITEPVHSHALPSDSKRKEAPEIQQRRDVKKLEEAHLNLFTLPLRFRVSAISRAFGSTTWTNPLGYDLVLWWGPESRAHVSMSQSFRDEPVFDVYVDQLEILDPIKKDRRYRIRRSGNSNNGLSHVDWRFFSESNVKFIMRCLRALCGMQKICQARANDHDQ